MLYDCWRQIADSRPNQLALSELATGRRWTFSQLATATESGHGQREAITFPQGTSAEFILELLRAWRTRQIVCPLELGQERPVLAGSLPDGIVHLKTTSASTGTPRLVMMTAEQLRADALNIVETMRLGPDWPNLGLISLAHSYGFSNLVLPLLLHGIPLILLGGAALPETVRRAVASIETVTVAAVPALWRTWHDANAITPNIALAISAGAPLPVELEQSVFARCGVKIHNFYGSSECGGIAYDATTQPRTLDGCVGAPMRNVHVSVAPDGCVVVRSKAVAQGYWPEASPRLGRGRFHTLDLGTIENGLIYLRGRASDQINVAGRKVLPETIERVLAAHPEVRACVAFGIPSENPQRGETIVACVAAGSAVTGNVLRQFAIERLPAWQVPRQWWLVESLAANHRGKLSRAEWRKRFLESQPGPQRAAAESPLKVSSPSRTGRSATEPVTEA